MGLDVLAEKARPVAMAGERLLPVLAPLAPLLPDGALRRGSVVSTTGSTSLALALLAGASAAGSWCAAVGLPSLGVVAAAEVGIALDRFPLVAAPANLDEWVWAVGALADAVDVVLARPPGAVREAQARRLAAKARERSAVLVIRGPWPGADVRLAVASAAWEGVGQGDGRLRARRVDVVANGRGAAAREKRVALWLPGPDGGVAVHDAAVHETVPAPIAGLRGPNAIAEVG
jgi:hypothetical protein